MTTESARSTKKDINVTTADHFQLAATFYFSSETEKSAPVILICSATGVKRRYYAEYARYLVGEGFSVLTMGQECLPVGHVGVVQFQLCRRLPVASGHCHRPVGMFSQLAQGVCRPGDFTKVFRTFDVCGVQQAVKGRLHGFQIFFPGCSPKCSGDDLCRDAGIGMPKVS